MAFERMEVYVWIPTLHVCIEAVTGRPKPSSFA